MKLANIHRVAMCFCFGHRRNCGRYSHSSGIRLGSTLRNKAIFPLVQIHWSAPSPHSVTLWDSVSGAPHTVHTSFWARLIALIRSPVGMISWMTRYHSFFAASETGAAHKLSHTLFHAVAGHRISIRMAFSPEETLRMVTKVA